MANYNPWQNKDTFLLLRCTHTQLSTMNSWLSLCLMSCCVLLPFADANNPMKVDPSYMNWAPWICPDNCETAINSEYMKSPHLSHASTKVPDAEQYTTVSGDLLMEIIQGKQVNFWFIYKFLLLLILSTPCNILFCFCFVLERIQLLSLKTKDRHLYLVLFCFKLSCHCHLFQKPYSYVPPFSD